MEGRVQDPILQPSCKKTGGKTSLFVRPRHAKLMNHFVAEFSVFMKNPSVSLVMNNRCMLWSLREHREHRLQEWNTNKVEATAAERDKKEKREHLQLICKLLFPSTPLLIMLKCTLCIAAIIQC